MNAVGGVRIDEPAADLAVLLAIVSSLRNRPLPREARRLRRGRARRRGASRAARPGAAARGGEARFPPRADPAGERAQAADRRHRGDRGRARSPTRSPQLQLSRAPRRAAATPLRTADFERRRDSRSRCNRRRARHRRTGVAIARAREARAAAEGRAPFGDHALSSAARGGPAAPAASSRVDCGGEVRRGSAPRGRPRRSGPPRQAAVPARAPAVEGPLQQPVR